MTEPANDTMPVRKTVPVPVSPQRAFELFTARFGEWWPLATHSVGEDQATGVVFGEGIGGAIVEVTFTPADEGHTVVELVHSGWENRPDGAAARAGYETGWNPVMKHYARFAVMSGLPARAT